MGRKRTFVCITEHEQNMKTEEKISTIFTVGLIKCANGFRNETRRDVRLKIRAEA